MSGMDFFGHQDRARATSKRLIVLFVLAVFGIIVALYVITRATLLVTDHRGSDLFDPPLFAIVALVTLGIIGAAMLVKTMQLRSGGGAVAQQLGGTPIGPDPRDPQERMLRNLVEEMAIASGVPVPEIYVLQGEAGINAFAAGWSPADAAIAVTRGCLDTLDRDELQGVIAHEFSHVFHGDMRLNIRLMGVLFGLVCIATIGRVIVRASPRSSGNKKDGAGAIILFGIGLLVIGYLGVFFARIIQAALSRQREFLADASAVQYTRNPRGIGMALAKIGGLSSTIADPHVEEASHMLFADGLKRFAGGVLATHPPLDQRIDRILPGFTQRLANAGSMAAAVAATPLPPGAAGIGGGAAGTAVVGGPTPRSKDSGVRSRDLVQAIGDPQPRDVDAARALLSQLPMDLAAAAHDASRAPALVLALLLDREPARREAQLRLLPGEPATLVPEIRLDFQAIARVDRTLRLPLFELAIPALRQLDATGRRELRERARTLAMADGALSPFEFALLRSLERHIRLADELPRRPSGRPEALVDHGPAATIVLSALAHAGADGDAQKAQRAFERGHRELSLRGGGSLLPASVCSGTALEHAVDALAEVSPLGLRNLVGACAEAAGADGVLHPDEADLLRALAALWDCPVPLVGAAPVAG
ncbi:MAG: M48 family metallopeptidase [Planctomycetes bacterium]|jgi:Zn-dependent protease with chaperone function|nr:M48 family metallopeptidase [Planctomycetota bacterium]